MASQENISAALVHAGNLYLQAEKLDIGYSSDVVVADVNSGLKPGEALGLIGTHGCGKSTLLKTIVGLLPLLGGWLSVFGTSPSGNHSRIAYLGQLHSSGFVLPIRAIDVVRMGAPDEEIVLTTMRIMGVEKLSESPLRSLYGGQQQRVYLALVLAHQADLLVLDEPATGLDVGGRELYLRTIKDELRRRIAIVMATHDIQE